PEPDLPQARRPLAYRARPPARERGRDRGSGGVAAQAVGRRGCRSRVVSSALWLVARFVRSPDPGCLYRPGLESSATGVNILLRSGVRLRGVEGQQPCAETWATSRKLEEGRAMNISKN